METILEINKIEAARRSRIKKVKNTAKRVTLYVTLLIISFLFVLPLFLTFMNSLQGLSAGTKTIIPTVFHWENYKLAVTLIPFGRYLLNSFIIVGITVSLSVVMNLVMGYAFARLRAPGKSILFVIVLSTLMIPNIVIMIPQYILYNKIGIMNTFWIWAINGLGGSAFYIFLYRQFFSAMPKELEEAAKIDGCTVLGTLFKIFVPCSVPVMAIVAINSFQGAWNDYMQPFMYLSDKKYPLAMALFGGATYSIKGSPNLVMDSLVNCAAIIMTVPALIIFFMGQRYLVEGIVTTGIKG